MLLPVYQLCKYIGHSVAEGSILEEKEMGWRGKEKT
jgi:hypothetical protein